MVEIRQGNKVTVFVGGKQMSQNPQKSNIGKDSDNPKVTPVKAALEANTKSQSSQILDRHQLRCLKQSEVPRE